MQNSYSPTFKMCKGTSQLNYYREVLRSCKRKSVGCLATCTTTQQEGGTNFTLSFFRSKRCTGLGANCFHRAAFSISKPSRFPLLHRRVTMNHRRSSVTRPKSGLGAEKGLCGGNHSPARPRVSQATASTALHLRALRILLGAITFRCSAGCFCDAVLTG